MPGDKLAARLAEMRDERVEALRRKARQDIALTLLDSTGSVDATELNRRVAEWAPPSEEQLANDLARKTAAAVEYEAGVVLSAQAAAESARGKATALRRQADEADGAAKVHDREATEAELRRREAQELADLAASGGNPAAASAPSQVTAHAGTAKAKGI